VRVQFAGCVYDSTKRQLVRDGVSIALTPKAFALLDELAKASPNPIRKEDLYDRLWPGTFVEPGNLHNLVSEKRCPEDRASFRLCACARTQERR
jgi:DNA-binding winged helix-turn-helix (wHTH) protein